MKDIDLVSLKKDLKSDRKALKHNFVDRITVRIDYKNILEIKDMFSEIQSHMVKIGFKDFQEGFINEATINLNDPDFKKSIEEERSIPFSKLRKSISYKFYDEFNNYFEITNAFLILRIFPKNYKEFDSYIDDVLNTMKILKNKVENLKILRAGIRKINKLFMKNITKLYDYYEVFNVDNHKHYERVLDFDSIYGSHSINYYMIDDNRLNYIQNLALGEDNKKNKLFRLITDYDGYIRSTDKELKIDLLKKDFINLNTLLFYFYKNTLNSDFFERLKNDKFEDNNLKGVKKNE